MAINWNWIEENRKEVSEMVLQGKGAMVIASKFESGKAFLDEIVQISKEIEQQKIQDDYNLELGQVINAKEKEAEAKKIASENKMNSDIEFISNVFKCTLDEAKALYEMSADMVGKRGAVDNLIAIKQQNNPLYFFEYKGLCASIDLEEAEENEIGTLPASDSSNAKEKLKDLANIQEEHSEGFGSKLWNRLTQLF